MCVYICVYIYFLTGLGTVLYMAANYGAFTASKAM